MSCSILLGFRKKRSARSQSPVNAGFVSSLPKSNSQPRIVGGWCLRHCLQPNSPCFWVQLERFTPSLAPGFQNWSAPTLRSVCAWRRDTGSLVVRRGGWQRIHIMLLQHLPRATSASASGPMRRDQTLISSSLLETRVGALKTEGTNALYKELPWSNKQDQACISVMLSTHFLRFPSGQSNPRPEMGKEWAVSLYLVNICIWRLKFAMVFRGNCSFQGVYYKLLNPDKTSMHSWKRRESWILHCDLRSPLLQVGHCFWYFLPILSYIPCTGFLQFLRTKPCATPLLWILSQPVLLRRITCPWEDGLREKLWELLNTWNKVKLKCWFPDRPCVYN